MKRQWSNMTYDSDQNRWTVDAGGMRYGLHCGECFDLSIASLRIPSRIEYDRQWYLIMPGARFNLRIRDSYKVEI